ncbi:MAG: hypothetical protein Q9208_000749 [Pyrenodesmia sp. 3 TL-2023]
MSTAARFRRLVTAVTYPFKYQVYISKSQDVALNLSIEDYLFRKSHPESTVLFLYINKPCIVIGRNQNPWLEVDHALLSQGSSSHLLDDRDDGQRYWKDRVKLIRRRSGGGTVFHDLGNLNFSVICPSAVFNRDRYAEVVVRAIRRDNPRARVNGRHDIVLDPGEVIPTSDQPDPKDTHRTKFVFGDGPLVPRKVSGSAYKLVRNRALHHGTCLCDTPNISTISQYLQSPARPFLKARGVESVRSPIANISGQRQFPPLTAQTLQNHIIEAFVQEHNFKMPKMPPSLSATLFAEGLYENDECASGLVDGRLLEIPEIAAGVRELESPEYLYGQTPQFILSTHPCAEDDRARPPLPEWFPPSARVYLKIKSGIIIASKISTSDHVGTATAEEMAFDGILKGKKVAEIESFGDLLGKSSSSSAAYRGDDVCRVSKWLDLMLGKTSGGRVEP